MGTNTNQPRYVWGAKLLHWVIASIVIVMLSATYFFDALPKESKGTAFMFHKSFGLTVLVLSLLLFITVRVTGRPNLPATVPTLQRYAARFVQYCLYLFLLVMPLTGWIMSCAAERVPSYFGLFSVPFPGVAPDKQLAELMNFIHVNLALVVIAFVAGHILAALKHHFYDKDDVLKNMKL